MSRSLAAAHCVWMVHKEDSCQPQSESWRPEAGAHRLENATDAVQDGEGFLVAAHELEADELVLHDIAVGVGQRGQRSVAQVHGSSNAQVLETHLHCGHIQP